MFVSDNGVMHLKVNENDKYAAVQTDARERAHSRHALAHIMSQCRGTLINNEPKRTCREDYGKNPVVTRWLVRPLNTIQYRAVPFNTIEYIKGKFICLNGTLHGKKVNAQYTIADLTYSPVPLRTSMVSLLMKFGQRYRLAFQ